LAVEVRRTVQTGGACEGGREDARGKERKVIPGRKEKGRIIRKASHRRQWNLYFEKLSRISLIHH